VVAPSEAHVLAGVELSIPPRTWRFFRATLLFVQCRSGNSVSRATHLAFCLDDIACLVDVAFCNLPPLGFGSQLAFSTAIRSGLPWRLCQTCRFVNFQDQQCCPDHGSWRSLLLMLNVVPGDIEVPVKVATRSVLEVILAPLCRHQTHVAI